MANIFVGLNNSSTLHSQRRKLIICNVHSTKFTKDKSGIGGSLLLHRFASLLPTPRPVFFTHHLKSSDK
jgi:hypothetical protein